MFSEKKKKKKWPTKFWDRALEWLCPLAHVWGWFVVPAGREFTISLLNFQGLITSQPHLLSLIHVPCIFELVLHLCSGLKKKLSLFTAVIAATSWTYHIIPVPLWDTGRRSYHFLSRHNPDPGGIAARLAPAMALFFFFSFIFLFLRAHLEKNHLFQSIWCWPVNS